MEQKVREAIQTLEEHHQTGAIGTSTYKILLAQLRAML